MSYKDKPCYLTFSVKGRVRRPEIRDSSTGRAILTFVIPIDDGYPDPKDHTTWVRVVAFGQRAEDFAPIATDGALVSVWGFQREEEWQTESGETRKGWKFVANIVEALEKRRPEPRRAPDKFDDDDIPF